MKRPAPFACVLLGALLASACTSTPPARGEAPLHCLADGDLDCQGAACEYRPDPYAHIDLALNAAQDGGNLCTGTYCRAFAWLALADATPRTFGPILSESSGSTEDLVNVPVVDYHLWISADRSRFALVPLEAGWATWVGRCQ